MSATAPILSAIETHLKTHLPAWDVALFPNDPNTYHLAHINGAVLISYLGSRFDAPRNTTTIKQQRHVQIALTVLTRDLHNDEGALALLDKLRLLVVGYRPPNCGECWLVDELFGGQNEETGIWHYQLILRCETMQVQVCPQEKPRPKMVQVITRNSNQPLDSRLKVRTGD